MSDNAGSSSGFSGASGTRKPARKDVLGQAREAAAEDPARKYSSEATRKLLIEKVQATCDGKTPYGWQLDVTEALLLNLDALVVAGTGAGKTLPFAMPLLVDETKRKMIIVISPLNELEVDQAERFEQMGLASTPVNGETYTNKLHDAIEHRAFRMLLTSPEMCLEHPKFSKLLRTPDFTNDVLAIIIDEAHCICQWGSQFRTKYSELAKLRSYVPTSVPILATSATLTPLMIAEIQAALSFSVFRTFSLNLGNNRPNLTPVVWRMRAAASDLGILDIALHGFESGSLTRTLIFFNSRELAYKAYKRLQNKLPLQMRGKLDFLHAGRSRRARKKIMRRFRRRKIKVLCATEAAGMGIDIKDIDLVIQFMVPGSLPIWEQRKGRGGRAGQHTIVLLLVEPSVFQTQKKRNAEPKDIKNKGKAKARGKAPRTRAKTKQDPSSTDMPAASSKLMEQDALQHNEDNKEDSDSNEETEDEREQKKKIEEGLRSWIETPDCRREIANQYFNNPEGVTTHIKFPCCDNCLKKKAASDFSIFSLSEQQVLDFLERLQALDDAQLEEKRNANGKRPPADDIEELENLSKRPGARRDNRLQLCLTALRTWRKETWTKHYSLCAWGPETLLPDSLLRKIALAAHLKTTQDIKSEVSDWVFADEHGNDVLRELAKTDKRWQKKHDEDKLERKRLRAKESAKKTAIRDEERNEARRQERAENKHINTAPGQFTFKMDPFSFPMVQQSHLAPLASTSTRPVLVSTMPHPNTLHGQHPPPTQSHWPPPLHIPYPHPPHAAPGPAISYRAPVQPPHHHHADPYVHASNSQAPQPLDAVYQAPRPLNPVYQPPQPLNPVYQPPQPLNPIYQPPQLLNPVYQAPRPLHPVYQAPRPLNPVCQEPQPLQSVYQPAQTYVHPPASTSVNSNSTRDDIDSEMRDAMESLAIKREYLLQ